MEEEGDSNALSGEEHYRARVFILTEDNDWRDVATGTFQCTTQQNEDDSSDNEESLVLRIIDEDSSDKVLWEQIIGIDHMPLTVQQDTVVSWTDQHGRDLALSFESLQGCESFFLLYSSLFHPTTTTTSAGGSQKDLSSDSKLPEKLSLSNLSSVRQVLRPPMGTVLMTGQRRTMLAAHVLAHDYVVQVGETFRLAQDLNQREALLDLAKIAEGLVALGNQSVLSLIISPDQFPLMLGVFEHSTTTSTTSTSSTEATPLRKIYGNTTRADLRLLFIAQADFDDLEVLLEETWRLQLLRDFVFGRFVEDDDSNGFLLTLIRTNQISILRELDSNPHYYETFAQKLADPPADMKKKVSLGFLKEYLNLARTLIPHDHFTFYQNASLMKALMDFLKTTCHEEEDNCKSQAIDILSIISQHDPSVIRLHGTHLVQTLIQELFLKTPDPRIRWNISTLLRALAKTPEPANGNAMLMLMNLHSPANSKGLDDFLNWLYPTQANLILHPLSLPISPTTQWDLVYHCCELLTFFIKNHKYRIKYLLLRSSVPQSLGLLLKVQMPHIQLAVLLALRAMLETGDDFYHRFFTKHRLLLPVLEHLHKNMKANDCVSSAMLELFSTGLASAPQSLIQQVVELDHGKVQELSKEYACFSSLLSKCAVQVNSGSTNVGSSNDVQYQRLLQQEAEDEYFTREDDAEDENVQTSPPLSSSSSSSGGPSPASPQMLVEDSPSKKLKYSLPPTTIN